LKNLIKEAPEPKDKELHDKKIKKDRELFVPENNPNSSKKKKL